MHYKLSDNIILRGWKDRPYAARDISDGKTAPLSEDVFRALSFCGGVMDIDSFIVPDKYKRIIKELAKRGIVKECSEHEHNAPHQEYKRYPCNYIATAHWSVTGKCNMSCRHCFMSAPGAKFGEQPFEKCMDIIGQLDEAGISEVTLTGGEPLVRDDFFDIVKALRDKNIRVRQIYTNGMLVSQKILDKLAEMGVKPSFSLSFDGVGWHDWIRGIDGAEKMAEDAIRLLVKNGYFVGIESAFHRNSIGTMEKTMLHLADLGVGQWKTNPAGKSGDWCNVSRDLDITTQELYDAYLELIGKYFEAGSPLSVMFGGFFQCKRGTKDYTIPVKKRANADTPLCAHARYTTYIAPDNKLLPCMPLAGLPIPEETPSLDTMKLTEALSDSYYMRLIEKPVSELIEHNEKCRDCEHKLICCGGCRAFALMEGDGIDYLAPDPATCLFFSNNYEEKIAHVASRYKV